MDIKFLYGPASLGNWESINSTLSSNDHHLDDSNDKVGQVLTLPKSGLITDVGFRHAVTVGSPPNYKASLQTTNTSSDPSGILYGGSAETEFTPGAVGWRWITLSTPANGIIGDSVAVVIEPTGTAPNSTNYITALGDTNTVGSFSIERFFEFDTAWSAGTYKYGAMALRYSDGTIVGIPATQFLLNSFDVNSVPNEYGAKFTIPFDCVIDGVAFVQNITQYALTFNVKIYDENDNILRTRFVPGGGAHWNVNILRIVPVTLSKNVVYKLTVAAINTTNIGIGYISFTDSAYRSSLPNGENFTWTSRNSGLWSDNPLIVPYMAVAVSELFP